MARCNVFHGIAIRYVAIKTKKGRAVCKFRAPQLGNKVLCLRNCAYKPEDRYNVMENM